IWSSQRGAHEWIETPGVVQRARAEKHDVGLGDPDDPHSRSKIYLVRIEFAATLDGRPVKQFADAPRQTPPDRNTRYEAEQAAATYKRGDPVTVYYLPGDPTTARLVPPPGSSLGTVALSGGLGLAALAIGLVGAWYMLFQFERRSPDENATAG
ncbi:MAG TPA: DUF3592 domain-containing protein, partial [Pirellulales bacterium]